MCASCYIGTCGRYRVAYRSNHFFGDTKYFKDDGALIGVHTFSDAIDPDCHGKMNYRQIPICKVEMKEEIPAAMLSEPTN